MSTTGGIKRKSETVISNAPKRARSEGTPVGDEDTVAFITSSPFKRKLAVAPGSDDLNPNAFSSPIPQKRSPQDCTPSSPPKAKRRLVLDEEELHENPTQQLVTSLEQGQQDSKEDLQATQVLPEEPEHEENGLQTTQEIQEQQEKQSHRPGLRSKSSLACSQETLFSPALQYSISSSSSSSSSISMEADEFNPFQFIALLPPYQFFANGVTAPLLPPKTSPARYTLVLDLDETLVHAHVSSAPYSPSSLDPQPTTDIKTAEPQSITKKSAKAQVYIEPIHLNISYNQADFHVVVGVRPCFLEFMQFASQNFEVILFTASNEVYANPLVNILDAEGRYFHHRLFRDSCLQVNENFLKDLSRLGRDLSNVIIVDNSPHVFGYQIDNGIPIKDWIDDEKDRKLHKVKKFLKAVLKSKTDDVRPLIREKYKLFSKVAEWQ